MKKIIKLMQSNVYKFDTEYQKNIEKVRHRIKIDQLSSNNLIEIKLISGKIEDLNCNEELIEEFIKLVIKKIEKYPKVKAKTYFIGGLFLAACPNYDKAIKYLTKAQKIYESIENFDDWKALFEVVQLLSIIYEKAGDLVNAQEYQIKALEVFAKFQQKDELLLADLHSRLSDLMRRNGYLPKSLLNKQKTLNIRKQFVDLLKQQQIKDESLRNLLSDLEHLLARTYLELSELYSANYYVDEALDAALEAVRMFESLPDQKHWLARAYKQLSTVYYAKADIDKAKEFALKALMIYEQNLQESNLELAEVYEQLGYLYLECDDKVSALHYLKSAYQIYERLLGTDDERTRNLLELINSLNSVS